MYDISFIEPSLLPRERLVSEGVDKLSHQELLSILLRTGNKKKAFMILHKVFWAPLIV